MMGFYHLTDGQHRELDSIRSRFSFKYHMAKWNIVAMPREFGGLGIINTRRMNDCLLTYWIWKIASKEDSLWCRLMYRKYIGSKDFFLI
jgi:hypothetical protein